MKQEQSWNVRSINLHSNLHLLINELYMVTERDFTDTDNQNNFPWLSGLRDRVRSLDT